MATYVSLVNELLRRLNEVPVDTAGDGFDSVRNVQALAKDAVNSATRSIIQNGQEWPFLKTTYTQTLTAGVREYDFPADYSSADWETFYLKKKASTNTSGSYLPSISYDEYIQRFRSNDDEGPAGGLSAPVYIYQTNGDKFGVTPVPNSDYEIEYVYWTYPSDMAAFNEVSIIPDRFKHVLLDGAMTYMMRFRSNEQSAAVHQQAFDEGIKSMRRVLIDEPLRVRSSVIDATRTSSNVFGRFN